MKLSNLLMVLFVVCLATGCIKEDTDSCPPPHNVTLHLNYVYHGSNNQFSQRVENVRLSLFDMSGNLVATYFKNSADLKSSSIALNLDPGDYRLVCWGNVLSNTDVRENNTLNASRVFHTQRSNGEASNGDPLFYAPRMRNLNNPNSDMLTITVPEDGGVVEKDIDFTAAHKTVEVLVTGFSDRGNINPIIEFNNIPSGYNFTLGTLPDLLMEYTQTGTFETRSQNFVEARTQNPSGATRSQSLSTATRAQEYSVTTFYLPLFDVNTPIELSIIRPSSGAVVHTISLNDYLVENGISLTHGDWDQINMLVEFSDLGAVVSVKPWEGSSVTPGTN